jgi:chromosome segregation ATPase
MIKDATGTPDLIEEWLQDLVEKVAHQLNVKKEMEILSCEIPKERNEIEYLRGRTGAARKRLDETENAIKEMQLRMAEPKGKLTHLEEERQLAVEQYDRLKEIQKDIEGKLSKLPKIKAEIRKFSDEVQKSSGRLQSLQSSYDEALQRKERLGQECESFKAKVTKLEEEIPVMKNTRDILRGKQPEHFDADTFETIKGDVEMTVESYVSEVEGEIEGIKKETSSLNARLDAKQEEEGALLSKKGHLQETIEGLRTHIGEDKNRETLMTEFAKLERQRNEIAREAEQKKKEVNRIESALKSVDDRLGRERQIESDSNKRRSYLISRKGEMGNLESVADEIQRLKDEIQRLNMDSEVKRTLHETIKRLNEEVDPTRRQLHSTFEEYKRVFGEFEREINSLLSA